MPYYCGTGSDNQSQGFLDLVVDYAGFADWFHVLEDDYSTREECPYQGQFVMGGRAS